MIVRRYLLILAVVLATSITGTSNISVQDEQRHRLQLLRSEGTRQMHLTPLDRAYLDALTLLQRKSPCSQFYGGSASGPVLDRLIITLRRGLFNDTSISLRMSGRFTSFVDLQSGISYRLFEHAEINSIGPFCRSKVLPTDQSVPKVGSFRPNTRQARVLILLHELAHLIKGPNGAWLIPDDGGNPDLSNQNNLTIESKCGEEIRALL